MSIYTTPGNLFRVINPNSLFYLSIGVITEPDMYDRNLTIIFDPDMLTYNPYSINSVSCLDSRNRGYQFIGTGDIIEHLNKL